MAQLIKQYFNIAFLMAKPQDLPAGPQQMHMGVLFSFFASLIASIGYMAFGRAALLSLLDIAISGAVLYAALYFTNRVARFEQAFGGLCGASAVLYCATIPMLWVSQPDAAGNISVLGEFSQFLTLVWSLSLVAHVIRHSFEIQLWVSVAMAFAYYILLTTLIGVFLPRAAPGEQTTHEVSSVCGELVTQCLRMI